MDSTEIVDFLPSVALCVGGLHHNITAMGRRDMSCRNFTVSNLGIQTVHAPITFVSFGCDL